MKSRTFRLSDREYIKPVRKFFKANKEKLFTEYTLCCKCKVTPSELRYAIASLRYEFPICYITGKGYKYTIKDKEALKDYSDKLVAQIKEKCIKNNIVKGYLR